MSEKKQVGWFSDCYYCAYGGVDSPVCRNRSVKPADSLCWTDNGDWMKPEQNALVQLRIKKDGLATN